MKNFKKMMALMLAMVMVLAMSSAVFAQTASPTTTDEDNASITITNPAKGETYTLYKLFDATVSSDSEHNIAYQGTVPSSLSDYFGADANGNISPKNSIKNDDGTTKMTDELKGALETWAKETSSAKVAEAESNGDELQFTGLPYGYYVMVTSHTSDPETAGATAKAAISVTSTKPDATINDKNVNKPSAQKEADKESYSVGDTITYTATFDAPNYMAKKGGTDGESEQVVSYTIKDTLPEWLTNPTITKVEVKQPGVATNVEITPTPAFADKQIEVKWVTDATVPNETHKYTSAYKAGSQIIVTYTAVLNSKAEIGKENKNKVSIMPNVDRGKGKEPYQENDEWNDEASITTHAAALIKTDGSKPLTGAKFKFKGLTLTGEGGIYTVVSYDPNGAADSGTEVEVGSDGKIIIGGIDKALTLVATETKAPEGYNQLTGTFNVPTIQMATTTTTTWGSSTTYYDAEGNVVDKEVEGGTHTTTTTGEYASISDIPAKSIVEVVNNKGVELPSTGGIGTTIFYIIGGILILGAAIALIGKKRFAR